MIKQLIYGSMLIKNFAIKIGYILLILYLVVFIPILFSYKPLIVVSGSMEPILKVGGILYYHEQDINKFKKKDILVYRYKNHIISHRIISKYNNTFITKGDSNKNNDSYIVYSNQVLGKGSNFSIPYIGYYVDFIYKHKYLLYMLILIQLYDLYIAKFISRKEIDYDT